MAQMGSRDEYPADPGEVNERQGYENQNDDSGLNLGMIDCAQDRQHEMEARKECGCISENLSMVLVVHMMWLVVFANRAKGRGSIGWISGTVCNG